jgi:hypothetical protein
MAAGVQLKDDGLRNKVEERQNIKRSLDHLHSPQFLAVCPA